MSYEHISILSAVQCRPSYYAIWCLPPAHTDVVVQGHRSQSSVSTCSTCTWDLLDCMTWLAHLSVYSLKQGHLLITFHLYLAICRVLNEIHSKSHDNDAEFGSLFVFPCVGYFALVTSLPLMGSGEKLQCQISQLQSSLLHNCSTMGFPLWRTEACEELRPMPKRLALESRWQ